MLGCIVSFGVSIFAIKFLMGYIKQHDFRYLDITVLHLGIGADRVDLKGDHGII